MLAPRVSATRLDDVLGSGGDHLAHGVGGRVPSGASWVFLRRVHDGWFSFLALAGWS